ncbi:VPLPA-CTERM sorting domain-containing protein [Salipiger mucosus]|uniref:PEP-CTERM protein-sorting domain-containing protein n=1 Tax=Salipiger mucosus DSM 16094 TaxID=1123237 RepID=S9RC86_9RHOB|nr:VPLPA-CTERM sorting domain-containing protein [Salipiger mucosus]EPX75735.1 hypothetical protein Salmuc_05373 [Salipiger mucosus DSM 16094]
MKTFLLAAAFGSLATGAAAITYDFNDATLPALFDSASVYSFRTDVNDASNSALAFTGSGANQGTTPAGVSALSTGGQLRHATTGALDLSAGGTLAFDFLFGTSATNDFGYYENADAGEDFIVAYSIDGGTSFTEFARIDTEDATYANQFGAFSTLIPTAAQTGSTQLSFMQVFNSGSSFDHWALDNLSVSAVAAVPLPASLPLLGAAVGAFGLFGARRRRKAA